ACFLSQVEPKKVNQALDDVSWVEAMQEELLQFKLLNVWILRMRVKLQKDHLKPNQYPFLLTQVKTNLSYSLTYLPDLLLLSLFLIPIQRVMVGIMEVTIQAKEIKDLKAQIKKLKKKAIPVITHHKA
ncbi:hypothetical protein Tco_0042364, partial [Tanacetum coccineum]